ncbi:hypothetical protein SLE2022_099340 [Rubroshorea leprosula]
MAHAAHPCHKLNNSVAQPRTTGLFLDIIYYLLGQQPNIPELNFRPKVLDRDTILSSLFLPSGSTCPPEQTFAHVPQPSNLASFSQQPTCFRGAQRKKDL